MVAQGNISAERLLLHARALPVYGASPMAQGGSDSLCISQANFVIAAARDCRSGQTPATFTEVKPTQGDDGHTVAYLAEDAEYDDEQARLAAIQRLLVIAGYDAAPIDGVDGPKTQNALAKFLRDRNLAAETATAPNFFETMIAAVQTPSSIGLTWCNDTPHRVMAAIGVDDGKAITTRGWYRIEPGKCLHPDIAGTAEAHFQLRRSGRPGRARRALLRQAAGLGRRDDAVHARDQVRDQRAGRLRRARLRLRRLRRDQISPAATARRCG